MHDREVVDGFAAAAAADAKRGAVVVNVAVHRVQLIVKADLHFVDEEPKWGEKDVKC